MADKHNDQKTSGERIAKVMARAGLCSRREAEQWIADRRVAVDGAVITSPALNVSPTNRITIDGKPLPSRERTRLFLYHKPSGLVTTSADPEGRPTIFGALPKDLPRLITVGRLDLGTEGLLLLTNDGGLARVLELPATGWLRRYRVRAHGSVTSPQLDALRGGIEIDGIRYGRIDATLDRVQGANVWLTFAIREGKNREVRNVLRHLGLQVNRLIRVSFGPFQLGELPEAAVEEVKMRTLREQLGERIARAAGVDFLSPVAERAAPEPATRPERAQRGSSSPRRQAQEAIGKELRGRGVITHKPRDGEQAATGRPARGGGMRGDGLPAKHSGDLTDRKGRRVVVERVGSKEPRPGKPPRPGRPSKPPPRDRSGGPRPHSGGLSDRKERRGAVERVGSPEPRTSKPSRPGRPDKPPHHDRPDKPPHHGRPGKPPPRDRTGGPRPHSRRR